MNLTRITGRFVAINYKGNVLETASTLEELDELIVSKGIKENYYVERLGHEAIANL